MCIQIKTTETFLKKSHLAKDFQSVSEFHFISPIQLSSCLDYVRQSRRKKNRQLQKASFLAVSLSNSIIVVARKKAINFSCSTHPRTTNKSRSRKDFFCLHLVIAKSSKTFCFGDGKSRSSRIKEKLRRDKE